MPINIKTFTEYLDTTYEKYLDIQTGPANLWKSYLCDYSQEEVEENLDALQAAYSAAEARFVQKKYPHLAPPPTGTAHPHQPLP